MFDLSFADFVQVIAGWVHLILIYKNIGIFDTYAWLNSIFIGANHMRML